MDLVYGVLLWIHIVSGVSALISLIGAMITKIFPLKHEWHLLSGRIFYYSMLSVVVTTLPMTFIKPNLFLFLIAVFSFYLAFAGRRFAVNRSGIALKVDYLAIGIMFFAGAIMVLWGVYLTLNGDGNGVTLMVFGGIGSVLSGSHYSEYRKGGVKGKERISVHLQTMMGAGIAAVTAFLVVNVSTDPVWIAWIAPTVVIVPFMSVMRRRLYRKKKS